uniref:Uncharacterized protein n=1 Tax=Glossina austeni TaxID=7395 RepID=A0A1A9V9P6_GLOAU
MLNILPENHDLGYHDTESWLLIAVELSLTKSCCDSSNNSLRLVYADVNVVVTDLWPEMWTESYCRMDSGSKVNKPEPFKLSGIMSISHTAVARNITQVEKCR